MLKTRFQIISTHLYESRTPQMEAQNCHMLPMSLKWVLRDPFGHLRLWVEELKTSSPLFHHKSQLVPAGTSW